MKKCEMCNEIEVQGKAKFCADCRKLRERQSDKRKQERIVANRVKELGVRYCEICKVAELAGRRDMRFCLPCRDERHKEMSDHRKRFTRAIEKRRMRQELNDNFRMVVLSPENLIPTNFNKISKISSSVYTQRFRGGWISTLRRHNKLNEFNDYIVSEYLLWSERTGNQTVGMFFSEIGVSGTLMDQFIYGNELREIAGFKKYSYSDKEYEEEFYRVINSFEELPTSTEFNTASTIDLYSFTKRHGIYGEVYIQLLEKYGIPQDSINHLLDRIKESKSIAAIEQLTGNYKISKEELLEDFKNVYDLYLEKYDTTPTIAEYDRLAIYGKTTIVSRLDMSHTEIAESLGYDIDTSGSPTEYITLENIKSILKCDYKSQAKFDWLRNDLNRNLFCDGYFEDMNLVVEYDGKQHFEMVKLFGQRSFERTQINDAIKNELIPQHGLTLLRIAYNEPYWNEDFLRMRLIEHGVIPPNHTLVSDSQSQQSKIA